MRRVGEINALNPLVAGTVPPPLLKYHRTSGNTAIRHLTGGNLRLLRAHGPEAHAIHLTTVPACNRCHFDWSEMSKISAQPLRNGAVAMHYRRAG